MQKPRRINEIYRFPVTGGICILSLVVTLAAWSGKLDQNLLVENYRVWHGQPWRLLTSTLLHANFIHLAFNLYWTWTFGSIVESAFGSLRSGLLILMLGAGSSAAEYAFGVGGVGLSGVGYGLFGFLWALGRYDSRFKEVIDAKTVQLFVGWFFLCIALTVTQVMPIGNIAHGAGAVLGAGAGYAVSARGSRKALAATSLSISLVGILLCSSIFRPKVNFSYYGGWDIGRAGYDAMMAGDDKLALLYLTEATKYRGIDSSCWYNLGITEQRLGNYPEAMSSYKRAILLNPLSKEYGEAARNLDSYLHSTHQ